VLLAYQQMCFQPIIEFSRLFSRIRKSVRKLRDIIAVLRFPDPLADVENPVQIKELQSSIEFHGVCFAYEARDSEKKGTLSDVDLQRKRGVDASSGGCSSPTLSNLSIQIKAGTTTAIVGRSGSGKSTLISLLLRFYDPSSGNITWDGVDLKNISRQSFRQTTSIVYQDTTLFNRSLAQNICYGVPNASNLEMRKAAKLANIDDFIMSLDDKYDTIVGERGVRLSGGQRQRIAIARALIKNPSLLVLDESTSSLDSESEHAIQQSILSLHHHVTQVIVAHRLSTVLHADQIIVMDAGLVVGIGTHNDLRRNCPIYARLCSLQFDPNSTTSVA